MYPQLSELTAQLATRLLRGEHLTLWGPRGSGKSAVLAQVQARLGAAAAPRAYSISTATLDDITQTLERAYPGVDTREVGRRTARFRLWNAADRRAGVLLLDHFHCNGSAMVSFLRRLHGKIAGVLTAVDVDDERERNRMRPWRYGAMSVRMPLATAMQLRRLLDERCRCLRLPPFEAQAAHKLVEAARGRPGWIVMCTDLARDSRYWCKHGPLVSVMCVDAEAAVRYEALGMLRPISAAHVEEFQRGNVAGAPAPSDRARRFSGISSRPRSVDPTHRG